MGKNYILGDDGRTPVACDLMEWARQFEARHGDVDPWRVARTEITSGVYVSTVFLGLDHQWGQGPPLLFETMIFGGEHNGWQDRYSTWDEAESGHAKAVSLASIPAHGLAE
jgi:hypothetical protein